MTKQHGLDTSGFLLLAEGHLVKARDAEASKDSPAFNSAAYTLIYDAMEKVRKARELLKQETKE